MGLTIFGDLAHKMPVGDCDQYSEGVNGKELRAMLLQSLALRLPPPSVLWMEDSAYRKHGLFQPEEEYSVLLGALEAVMLQFGVKINVGQGVAAAWRYTETAGRRISPCKRRVFAAQCSVR